MDTELLKSFSVKRTIGRILGMFIVLSIIMNCVMLAGAPNVAHAATYTGTITVNSSITTDMQNYGIRGLNNPMQKSVMEFTDSNVINWLKPLDLGWIRWPGGTNAMYFNWKIGYTDKENIAQIYKNGENYIEWLDSYKRQEGTQIPERLSDFKDLLQQIGAKTVIPVSAMNSVTSVADLAQFVKDNNIPVLYWEMGNEVQHWMSGDNQILFKDGSDYVEIMKPYNDAIKSILPDAKTILVYSNNGTGTMDQEIYNNYPNPWWDGITFHRYEGYGTTIIDALKDANSKINSTLSQIDSDYIPLMRDPDAPIFIGEYGVDLSDGNIINGTAYNGLFLAESQMRLSTHPNVKHFGGYRIYDGYMGVTDNHLDDARDKYQRGQTQDTTQLNFGMYTYAPAVMTKVSDIAINNSSKMFETTVTGGTTVDKNTGTMPAIYAQAYKGDYGGKNYLVITNKSDSPHTMTLKDGSGNNITAALTKVSAKAPLDASGNPDPLAKNTDTDQNNVSISTTSTNNPVSIDPYSVTRIEWTETRSDLVPKAAWITHADTASTGSVQLKWLQADGATSYKVKYGTTSGSYSTTISSITDTFYTVTGLNANTTYYFKVDAVNSTGTTTSTNEVSAKTSAPAAPLMRYSVKYGDATARVEWQSVPGAAGYKVKYGTTSGTYPNVIDVGNMCGSVVKGLTNDLPYYFVVTAYNACGESMKSNEDTVTTVNNPALAPNSAYVSSQTATSATIEWTPSLRPAFTGYFETGDGSDTGWTVQTGSAFSVVNHPDSTRLTKVFQSPTSQSIITKGSSNQYDYDVSARVYVTQYGSNGRVGVMGRLTDNNNHYSFKYNGDTDSFALEKKVNGNVTSLASISLADSKVTNESDMRLTLRFLGTKIECYVESKQILEATDSSHTSGYWGLFANQTAYFDEMYANVAFLTSTTTYKLYRSTSPDGTYNLINGNIIGNSYTDNTCNSGVTYYYKLKGENNICTSVRYSNIATKD